MRIVGTVALLAVLLTAAPALQGGPVQVGTLAAPGLAETSGMVASSRRDDLLWLVNDSGNRPELYAVGTDGRDLGHVVVDGADNHDWEDIAAFTREGRAYLLIADVGDNTARRETVTLYAVVEPVVGEGALPETMPLAWTQRFRYPDGPKDCEAVAVDPRGPTVLLLSKRQVPPRLFSLPLGPSAEVAVAEALGEVKIAGKPTALDIAPDGRLALLNYDRALVFAAGSSPAEALAAAPRIVPLPPLRQAEALAFGRDGSLWVTSEGRGAPLFRLEDGPPAESRVVE